MVYGTKLTIYLLGVIFPNVDITGWGAPHCRIYIYTWWLILLSKWVITPVINGISRVNPLITGVN